MIAHKTQVTVAEDHQVNLQLPRDFPAGPAEVIVRVGRREAPAEAGPENPLAAALTQLRALKRTVEEDQILSDFAEFREVNPFQLGGLRPLEP